MNRYGLPEIEGGALDDDDPQVQAFDRFNGFDTSAFLLTHEGLRRWHTRLRKTSKLAIIDVRIADCVSRLSRAVRDGDAKAEAVAVRRLRKLVVS